MHRVGISFNSSLSPDVVRTRYITPLRTALEDARAGIYANYLRQLDEGGDSPEHLLVFEVHDFQTGLRLLRLTMEKLGPPGDVRLHNLDSSEPMY